MKTKYNKLMIDRYEEEVERQWPGVTEGVKTLPDDCKPGDLEVLNLLSGLCDNCSDQDIYRDWDWERDNGAALVRHQRWLMSRQAYEIDDELARQLKIEPGDEIAKELFDQLPYECFYVYSRMINELFERHNRRLAEKGYLRASDAVEGFLVWRNGDEIILTFIDEGAELASVKIDLNAAESVGGIVAQMWAQHETRNGYQKELSAAAMEGTKELISHALGMLAYIASAEADIATIYNPRIKTKNWKKYRERSTKATVSQVGWRLGRELGAKRRAYEAAVASGNGPKKAPHVRRAHWHTYYLGPKDDPTDLVVHWIPPIYVHGGYPIAGTIHESKNHQ